MSAVAGVPSVDEGLAAGAQGQLERSRGERRTPGAWVVHHWVAVKHWLPKGQLLPEHVLRRRHRAICGVLWLHIPALFTFGMLVGNHSISHVLFDCSLIAILGLGASMERFRLKARMIAASFGLMTCSAVLVDLWNGQTEAHFHFFVMIGVLTLYQDWTPFLIAIGFVVIHHGVGGMLDPRAVFGNNPSAIKRPWEWAGIHGFFVLAASVAHVVAWRTNENQLLRDPLTGLPSRVLYLNNLKLALERLGRGPARGAAVLFLDLDRFKVINDSLGHGEGDELLVAVSERVSHSLRRHETLARFGGDEFVILCEDIYDDGDAVAVAERVLKAFSLPFQLAHGETMAAASIGISLTSDPDQDPEDLIRDADAAMYRAKAAGGARVVLFDEVTRERALARLHNENAIRKAIDREEFRVFFQPEVSIDGQHITGMEALVRWQHPERGLLGPGEFISLAEETGLIVPLGAWVLRDACKRAVVWQRSRAADQPLMLRVNVSARQLAQESLRETVAEIMRETGIEPSTLCLEVTESVLIEDPESSIETLTELKKLGVKIAIDDFGTGYSSLEYLRRMPVDCVKVDRSFVRGLPDNEEDVAIVNAVIELGHALKLSVTAEGVETTDQLGNLQSAGCDTAQGFLFFRPEPPEELEKLFAPASVSAPAPAPAPDSPEPPSAVASGESDSHDAPSPVTPTGAHAHAAQARRRPVPPLGSGHRRRLARRSLAAGFRAAARAWVAGESEA
ncbi:MAG TPA: EAL domain-containing protein [Solirubrobacteraceae bacterium]|nr:EAL domain-containing protein [Solirubrobacteraceae bacterium]